MHSHSPKQHILGLFWSLLLTFAALWVTLEAPLPLKGRITIIVILAIIQFLIQLVFFMHVTESNERVFQIINIVFGVFIAITVVAGSIWLMLYNTMQ